MISLLWLTVALPLASFIVLALAGARLPRTAIAWLGAGAVGLSFLVALAVAAGFPASGTAYVQTFWTWLAAGGLNANINLYLDSLSLVMLLIVTGVGFLIHVYSTSYMADDPGYEGDYARFFAYMNLFVASMVLLVLADNLLTLLLGWEGVGLCSYLLIGFWYKDPGNGRAARKAFVVTRVGDTALLLGIFLLFAVFGTLQIQELSLRAPREWAVGSPLAVAAAALLLGGAVGKSAQLPLQTWLPDAMAGPTPVSALIHAATMVTAGVYLIARTHVLFELAPPVQFAVAVIGALTLLLAASSALAQTDIKRALAYSTISQIGYMFLALGVGAYSAAIFHLMTHAFFKALLFMAAGSVILALHHEQNLAQMGGLRRALPLTFWTFLAGTASLAALPLITAGFYSKDLILAATLTSDKGGAWFWAAGLVGTFLTAVYAFRLLFLVFYGPRRTEPLPERGPALGLPLVVLALLAIGGGFIPVPQYLGNVAPPLLAGAGLGTEAVPTLTAALASLAGVVLTYYLYLSAPAQLARLRQTSWAAFLARWWQAGWGFDALYFFSFVIPYSLLADLNRSDIIGRFYRGLGWIALRLNRLLSASENGRLRWYALGITLGAAILLAIGVWQ
ncbi:MAG: NADH-quinone oxidoreductase subunit L [Chloroflexi bacterium]|nr:NADH-quinone oxidoreductase subunit L [Chloroflexota bacterium]